MSRTVVSEMKDPDLVMERPLSLALVWRVLATLGRDSWLVIFSCILVSICVWADLEMISRARILIDQDDLFSTPILTLVTPFIVLALVNRITGWAQWVVAVIGAQRAIARLRIRFFNKLQSMSKSFYDVHRAGWLVARSTGDMGTLLDFMTFALMMLGIFFTTVSMTVYKVGRISPVLLLPGVVIVPVAVAITSRYKRKMSRVQRSAREKNSQLVANMAESVRGIRVVQAFSREERNLEDFNALNLVSHDLEIRAARLNALFIPSMNFLGILNMTIVVCFGSWMVHSGSSLGLARPLSPGDLVAYVLFMNVILMPVRMIVELYSMALRAMAAAERIYEIIDAEPDVQDAPDALTAEGLKGDIRLDHVSFKYGPDLPNVLTDIHLQIVAGETVAFVGRTGAGKTTIAGLVARFYDTTEGKVLIDDIDVRRYAQDSLHRNLAIVPQEGFLFTGTVLENLRLRAPDASREKVVSVAQSLGTHEAIMSLPTGYDTLILEGGRSISEGQRQLLSITRALLAEPRILILDEPTSSLDVHTEAVLQNALAELVKGRTTLVIAHRLSTIRRADRIVVIDDGRLVESGTHAELMELSGIYARFVKEGESAEGMVS